MASRSSILCWDKPMDRWAWQVTVRGYKGSLTWLESLSTQTSINLEKTNFSKHKTLSRRWQTGWPGAEPQGEQCYGIPAELWNALSVTEYSVLWNTSVMEYHHQPKRSTTRTHSQKGKKKCKLKSKYDNIGEFPKKRVNVRKETIIGRKVSKQRKDLVVSKSLTEF